MSNPVSTHHNPYCQGGWKPYADEPQIKCAPPLHMTYVGLPGHSQPAVARHPTTHSTSSTLTSDAPTTFRVMRYTPSTSGSRRADCVVVNSNNRIIYTIAAENMGVIAMKDVRGKPVVIVDSSFIPSIDIKGGGGKRRIDEWLKQDATNPCVPPFSPVATSIQSQ